MGNCGTREENAVVAAHAQGILRFLGFDFLGDFPVIVFLGCWLLGWDLGLDDLNFIKKIDLGGYF